MMLNRSERLFRSFCRQIRFLSAGCVLVLTIAARGQDCDSNGTVDGCDYRVLADCLAGPEVITAPPCPCADGDGAGTVDLADFAALQAGFAAGAADCDGNGLPDSCDADCNTNGVADGCDIAGGTSVDFNDNGVPDECDPDCQPNGFPDYLDIIFGISDDCDANTVPDECDLQDGIDQDCNSNGRLDGCDIAGGTSSDCNSNGTADDCEPDCNTNGVPDDCDLSQGTSRDCQTNGMPDECVPGYADCDFNGTADACELAAGDCNSNGLLDACEHLEDCNTNGVRDPCDIVAGTSQDCQSNGLPDECEIPPPDTGIYFLNPTLVIPDNQPAGVTAVISVPDAGTIAGLEVGVFVTHTWQGDLRVTLSHNGTTVTLLNRPGSSLAGCGTFALGYSADNFGTALSPLVLRDGAVPSIDCYAGPGVVGIAGYAGPARPTQALAAFAGMNPAGNWTLRVSDHAAAQTGVLRLWALVIHRNPFGDCNDNGVPDECDGDCNANGLADVCDIGGGTSADCQSNGVPDECEIAAGSAHDCDTNGVLDSCDLADGAPDCDSNGFPDVCDVDADSSGVPDECEIRVIYVNSNATGLNDGTRWGDAHSSLQSALADGTGSVLPTQIWVAAGVYRPAASGGDRAATFTLRNRFRTYGGFFGDETDADQRDPAAHPTTLSGDLNGDDGPNFAGNAENSYHVVTASGTDATAVLEGFTITGGNANGASGTHDRGGGMISNGGWPTVSLCDFVSNQASNAGGAAYIVGGGPTFLDTTFTGNAANLGGAIYIVTSSTPQIAGCVFSGNTATDSGGALFVASNSRPVIVACTFTGNRATNRGGALYVASFAGPMLINCAVVANSAANGGGALYAAGTSAPALTNCAVCGNWSSTSGRGLAVFQSSTARLTNCLLWANPPMPAGANATQADQLFLSAGTAVVNYSCVQGWTGALGGVGNIATDPLLVRNPNDGGDGWGVGGNDDVGDVHLQAGSPGIDAGNNNADVDPVTAGVQFLPAIDLDGQPRFVDDPLTLDTGVGTPPVVDLGAHEGP